MYVDAEVVLHAVRGADGEITEIQSSTRDVSTRVAAEAARRSAEDVFRLAMENAPMGMAVLGLDGRWITVNSALPRITEHQQLDFERLSMLEIVHPDDRDDVASTMRAMVEGTLQTCESEIRLITANGGYVWVERSTTLVRDANGAPSYFVLQVVDISDRIRAQEKLARRAVTDPLTGLPEPARPQRPARACAGALPARRHQRRAGLHRPRPLQEPQRRVRSRRRRRGAAPGGDPAVGRGARR